MVDKPDEQAPRVWIELLLPWLTALLIWPHDASAQRDPETELQRKPGGSLQLRIPVPPALREGLDVPAAPTQTPPYFREREEGWFWYRDPAQEAVPPPPAPAQPPVSSAQESAPDPRERIARQREELERLQALAILEPTQTHVAAYLEKHAALMDQSERFADTWQQVVRTSPQLDHTLRAPTGNAAYVQADVDAASLDQRLSEASNRYGLLFFFRGSCPYCHRFAPVLQAFAQRYGFDIVPVTLDGGSLPEFPNPQRNQAAASSLQVDSVPAVYLIEPRTRRVAATSFGYVGYSELAQRVDAALTQLRTPGADQGLALNGAVP